MDKWFGMDLDLFDKKSGMGFLSAFIASFSVILVSEVGDKTFFIAAIFSMKFSRLIVFLGAMGALVLMTILSALLGYATTVVPRWITHYLSSLLFFLFGLKMLYEAYSMDPNEGQNEYESIKSELEKKETSFLTIILNKPWTPSQVGQPAEETDIETGAPPTSMPKLSDGLTLTTEPNISTSMKIKEERNWNKFASIFSPIFIQSFILTFVAEWGDRSQLSTIILSAKYNLYGVIIGGVVGHSLCTGLAVVAGRFVSQKLSLKTVHFIGAIVFILSAIYILFFDV